MLRVVELHPRKCEVVFLIRCELEINAGRIGFLSQIMETFIVNLDSHINDMVVCAISKWNKHVSRQAVAKAA